MPETAAPQPDELPRFADLLQKQIDEMHDLVAELAGVVSPPIPRPPVDVESELLGAVSGAVVLLARWAIAIDQAWEPERIRQREAAKLEHDKIAEVFRQARADREAFGPTPEPHTLNTEETRQFLRNLGIDPDVVIIKAGPTVPVSDERMAEENEAFAERYRNTGNCPAHHPDAGYRSPRPTECTCAGPVRPDADDITRGGTLGGE